jgi:hypothetical protein
MFLSLLIKYMIVQNGNFKNLSFTNNFTNKNRKNTMFKLNSNTKSNKNGIVELTSIKKISSLKLNQRN